MPSARHTRTQNPLASPSIPDEDGLDEPVWGTHLANIGKQASCDLILGLKIAGPAQDQHRRDVRCRDIQHPQPSAFPSSLSTKTVLFGLLTLRSAAPPSFRSSHIPRSPAVRAA